MKKLTTNKDLDQLTPKQAKFLKLWLEHGNGTKAAMEVYDCKDENSAAVMANETLRKLKNPMKLFLEKHGCGVGHLAKIVMDATTATKTDITGDVHPDHKIRLEAGDRLSRWLEVEPKDNQPVTAIQVNIHPALLEKYGKDNL